MSEYANFHHRLPRQTAKRALIADNNSPLLPFNPLLSPQMNKGRISDEIRKITTTTPR